MRMTVASVSAAAGGTCSRSNACAAPSRVIALAPSALRSSVSSTAAASPSQKMRPSRLTFSNGMTRMRAGGVCALDAALDSALRRDRATAERREAARSPTGTGDHAPRPAASRSRSDPVAASSATFSTQVGSPVPRHATTSARALMSNSASSRVNAAA